jgi:hypothetical protein
MSVPEVQSHMGHLRHSTFRKLTEAPQQQQQQQAQQQQAQAQQQAGPSAKAGALPVSAHAPELGATASNASTTVELTVLAHSDAGKGPVDQLL